MTNVGDRIEQGSNGLWMNHVDGTQTYCVNEIPADVLEVRDGDEDLWTRRKVGWLCVTGGALDDTGSSEEGMLEYAPFTVTRVEQPKVSTQFAPGDRVRVTYEALYCGEYELASGAHVVRVDIDGSMSVVVPKGSVEIIDDPASDPVGTVRRYGGEPYIKVIDTVFPWQALNAKDACYNRTMVGAPIVGTVPGSPADAEGGAT